MDYFTIVKFNKISKYLDIYCSYCRHKERYKQFYSGYNIEKKISDIKFYLDCNEVQYRQTVVHRINRMQFPQNKKLRESIDNLKPWLLVPSADLVKLHYVHKLLDLISRRHQLKQRLIHRSTRRDNELYKKYSQLSVPLNRIHITINNIINKSQIYKIK